MNISQLHEYLRLEMVRRVDSGRFTAVELARLVGFTPAHLSNFLNAKRMLGRVGLDKLLDSQSLSVAMAGPETMHPVREQERVVERLKSHDSIPLVDPLIAAVDPRVPPGEIQREIIVSKEILAAFPDKCSVERRTWDRFVALTIPSEDRVFMGSLLPEGVELIIDRHYTSAVSYPKGRRSLYAVRPKNRLKFRYAESSNSRLILTLPHRACMSDVIELPPGRTSADYIVGRVCLYGGVF